MGDTPLVLPTQMVQGALYSHAPPGAAVVVVVLVEVVLVPEVAVLVPEAVLLVPEVGEDPMLALIADISGQAPPPQVFLKEIM